MLLFVRDVSVPIVSLAPLTCLNAHLFPSFCPQKKRLFQLMTSSQFSVELEFNKLFIVEFCKIWITCRGRQFIKVSQILSKHCHGYWVADILQQSEGRNVNIKRHVDHVIAAQVDVRLCKYRKATYWIRRRNKIQSKVGLSHEKKNISPHFYMRNVILGMHGAETEMKVSL